MHELGHGLQEHDAMRCRSCGNEERASEGVPCESCSTFICLMCQLKGIQRCAACDGRPLPALPAEPQTKAAQPAAANAGGNDDDQLIDYLFDQLTPPDERPTP